MDRNDRITMPACAAAFFFLAALMAYEQAHAAKEGQDNWGDPHAKIHWAGAYGLGAISSRLIENKWLAFAAAEAPLIYREEWKKRHGFSHYQPSRNVAHIVGAGLGMYTDRCLITARSITCKLEF